MTHTAGLWALAALVAFGASLCFAGERKQPDELPSVKELPNPFVRGDGSKVDRREDWPPRRGELKELVQAYEYGHLPPAAPVTASERPWKPAGKQAIEAEAKRAEGAVPLPAG